MCRSKSVYLAAAGLLTFMLACVSADEYETVVTDEHGDVVYYEDDEPAVLVEEHETVVTDEHGDVVYYEDDEPEVLVEEHETVVTNEHGDVVMTR